MQGYLGKDRNRYYILGFTGDVHPFGTKILNIRTYFELFVAMKSMNFKCTDFNFAADFGVVTLFCIRQSRERTQTDKRTLPNDLSPCFAKATPSINIGVCTAFKRVECVWHVINPFRWDVYLTQDFNKSGKKFQMRKIRFFSLLAHKNLIQYDEECCTIFLQSIIVLIWQIGKIFDVGPFEGPYVPESQRSWKAELNCRSVEGVKTLLDTSLDNPYGTGVY